MLLLVNDIKTDLRHLPTVPGIPKYILMEIAYVVLVVLVHLTNAFGLYDFMQIAAIDF